MERPSGEPNGTAYAVGAILALVVGALLAPVSEGEEPPRVS